MKLIQERNLRESKDSLYAVLAKATEDFIAEALMLAARKSRINSPTIDRYVSKIGATTPMVSLKGDNRSDQSIEVIISLWEKDKKYEGLLSVSSPYGYEDHKLSFGSFLYPQFEERKLLVIHVGQVCSLLLI